jgi:Conserved oligomeric complex COG6
LNHLRPKEPQAHSLALEARSQRVHRPDLTTLIENQRVSNYREVLEAFRTLVRDPVADLNGQLEALSSVNAEIERGLWESKQKSRNLIDEIGKLEGERKKLRKERDLAEVSY